METITALARELGVLSVVVAHDCEPQAIDRDRKVFGALAPAVTGPSYLRVYLWFGTISIRRFAAAAIGTAVLHRGACCKVLQPS